MTGGIAAIIILLVYAYHSITPFGDITIYRSDLYQQYGPLFSELYDRLTSGESLLYSWNTGLGGSFLGNFYNYLSSPFNLLVLLFGRENIFEAVAAMIAIKAILSSISMTFYLKKSQNTNNPSVIIFGLLYAFCAYFVAYYWNVMWMDAMYMLPLIVLGIEKIIKTGKCAGYIVALSYAIYTNYYIGFMLCIFSCIYFLYYYICSSKELAEKKNLIKDKTGFVARLKNSFFLQSGIRFAVSSLSVGILLLFMLVPVANCLSYSSATSGGEIPPFETYFNVFDFLANHLAALEPTVLTHSHNSLPNVYCGMLTVLLIPLYLFSKQIKKTEKIATVVLLVFMYFSFNTNYANALWHGCHFPNALPFRQSFMYSFILLVIAFKIFKNTTQLSKKSIIVSGIGVIAFIIVVAIIGSRNVNVMSVIISLIFVLIYTVVLVLAISPKARTVVISIVLTCSVVAEIMVANTGYYKVSETKYSLTKNYNDFQRLQSEINVEDSVLFYREELTGRNADMDASWYDFNGVSVFSSMTYANSALMQKSLGMYGNDVYNRIIYNPQTPVYNAMFSLKYLYDNRGVISECDYYTKKSSNTSFVVYENNYALNLAYPVSENLISWNASDYVNPIEAQQEYFKLATGVDGVYNLVSDYEIIYDNISQISDESKISGKFTLNRISEDGTGSAKAKITALNDENIYVYILSEDIKRVSVTSSTTNTTIDVSRGCIWDLGKYSAGEEIYIDFSVYSPSVDVDFMAFTINKDLFEEGYEKLKDGQIEYTYFDDTVIKGTFVAEDNEILYTSIPYDKGWSIYIDGKPVKEDDIIAVSDALIGIKSLSAGEHRIELIYEIVGMKACIAVSTIFAILLIALYVMKQRKLLFFSKNKKNIWQLTNE